MFFTGMLITDVNYFLFSRIKEELKAYQRLES